MAGSDIRAGKAFVELGVKDQLTKALKGIGKQVEAFGKGVTAIGKKFAMLGGAITAPMLAATASWAASGAELYRLTQKTGMSAEALSALHFAAEESGGSADGMTAAVRKMNMAMAEAERGSAEMTGAFAQLGLSVEQLKGMSPDQQFAAMADKISQIRDPAQQTAFAMKFFGRGAMELMPLLKQGAAGLAKYREEAEAMGLVKSTESVKAAFDLDMAWKRMGASLNTIKGAVATVLAPMLQGIAKWTTTIAGKVREWAKTHQPLIQLLFMTGAALVGVGGALAIGGKAISIFGGAIGKLTKVFSLFGPLLNIVGIALGFLLTPVGLLVAAVAGLGIYFLKTTGMLDEAITWLSDMFAGLLKDAKASFGAIADALEAGEISLAWKVVTLQMKVWWEEACLWFREKWEGFKTWLFTTFPNFSKGFINAFAGVTTFFSDMFANIAQLWNKTVAAIAGGLLRLAQNNPKLAAAMGIDAKSGADLKADAVKRSQSYLARQQSGEIGEQAKKEAQQRLADNRALKARLEEEVNNHDVSDGPVGEHVRQGLERANRDIGLDEEFLKHAGSKEDQAKGVKHAQDQLAAAQAKSDDEYAAEWLGAGQDALDKQKADRAKGIEDARKAREAAIKESQDAWLTDVDTGNASGKGRIDAGKKAVADARGELADAQAAAHKAADDARKKKKEEQKKPELGGIDAMLGGRSQVAGTFSAAAAAGMGGTTHWQKMLAEQKRGNVINEREAAALDKLVFNLAVGH